MGLDTGAHTQISRDSNVCIDTSVRTDSQGHQFGYRDRSAQMDRGTSVGYTQFWTQIDRDTIVGIDTGVHTHRDRDSSVGIDTGAHR